MNHLPSDIARCVPTAHRCKQRDDCARANDWPGNGHYVTIVDASISLTRPHSVCPIFIDKRTVNLQEAA